MPYACAVAYATRFCVAGGLLASDDCITTSLVPQPSMVEAVASKISALADEPEDYEMNLDTAAFSTGGVGRAQAWMDCRVWRPVNGRSDAESGVGVGGKDVHADQCS